MFNNGVNTNGLRWRPRLKVWKSSNNVFDPETMEAHSYGWWCYFRVINGLNVFNDFSYSTATRGHQRELLKVLKELKIKIHVTVETRESLDKFSNEVLFEAYLSQYRMEVCAARKRIKPTTRRNFLWSANEHAKSIQKLRKLGLKCSKAKQSELRKRAEREELERLASLKSASELEREQARVMRRERDDVLNNSWINVA